MKRTPRAFALLPLAVLSAAALLPAPASHPTSTKPSNYLGFDLNLYPGDEALPILRKTFTFGSFWLGPPPGERTSNWTGKRKVMEAQGFGLVVLYNGPLTKELKSLQLAEETGGSEALRAADLLQREGFPQGTIVFLDIEDGGRLSANYHAFLNHWFAALTKAGYRAGVYCSGMPAPDGPGAVITTAQDIQSHSPDLKIHFWVFNDRCPPSPGCVFPKDPPAPGSSGVADASVWQFAQSPRRKEFTASCPAGYHADGNCYAPSDSNHRWILDVNVANSPNPSQAP